MTKPDQGFIRSFSAHPPEDGNEKYPFSLPAVREAKNIQLSPSVTFFIGENGTGKSTLIEALAIAAGFNAEGGSKNFTFSTRKTESILHDSIQLVRNPRREKTGFFLRAESFYNVATSIDKMDEAPGGGRPIIHSYGGKSLHKQSHGESFMALVENRFGNQGLYILDEPEAALSPTRQMTLLAHMHALVSQGSQFVIATHSPILLAYPEACIYELDQKGIHTTPYEETSPYFLTLSFLSHYKTFIHKITEEEINL